MDSEQLQVILAWDLTFPKWFKYNSAVAQIEVWFREFNLHPVQAQTLASWVMYVEMCVHISVYTKLFDMHCSFILHSLMINLS